jgi:hypothetical protein
MSTGVSYPIGTGQQAVAYFPPGTEPPQYAGIGSSAIDDVGTTSALASTVPAQPAAATSATPATSGLGAAQPYGAQPYGKPATSTMAGLGEM